MMDYTLVRSGRKTLAIHITKEATVEVRAPMTLSKAQIDQFVAEKASWIAKHQREVALRNEQKEGFALTYGDTVAYLGKSYPIEARLGNRVGFDGQAFTLPYGWDSQRIQQGIIAVYKGLAKETLQRKVAYYSALMGVSPSGVKVNSASTRWGSCNSRGGLNFSWRLILAEDAVVDYVVVHELAHIKEMNHSPRFWAVVAQILPDHQDRRENLKTLQHLLERQGW